MLVDESHGLFVVHLWLQVHKLILALLRHLHKLPSGPQHVGDPPSVGAVLVSTGIQVNLEWIRSLAGVVWERSYGSTKSFDFFILATDFFQIGVNGLRQLFLPTCASPKLY